MVTGTPIDLSDATWAPGLDAVGWDAATSAEWNRPLELNYERHAEEQRRAAYLI